MHNKNAGGSIRKLINKLKFIIQINFPIPHYITNYHVQFANDLYLTLGKERLKVVWSWYDERLYPLRWHESASFEKFAWKNSEIPSLYLKKRVISNRNLISENIYVLEGLLNVSLTAHTSSAYLITNSNIWLFCLSLRYLSLLCLFPIVDFFQKWWFLLEMKRSNACTIPGCYTWYSVKCCFDTNDNWMRAGCKYLCAWESFQYLE